LFFKGFRKRYRNAYVEKVFVRSVGLTVLNCPICRFFTVETQTVHRLLCLSVVHREIQAYKKSYFSECFIYPLPDYLIQLQRLIRRTKLL